MANQSLKQKTTIGIFWSFIEKFSVQIVQLILSLLIARILNPSDYGLIGMLTIFTAISNVFIESGFTNALIQKQDRTETDFSTAFFFNAFVGIVCYLILYFTAPLIARFYNTPALIPIIRILFINIIINSLCIVHNTKLIIDMNFKTRSLISLVSVIVSGIVGVFMAYNDYGVWALVGQSLSLSIMTTLLFVIIIKWRPLFVFSKKSFHQLFSFGSKLLATGLVATIMNNLYTVLIGKYFTAKDVGYYTKGMQVPTLASSTLTSVLQGVTFPVLTSVQNEKERLVSIYRRFMQTTCFFAIPIMIALAIITEPFIRFFLTEKWMPAVPLMQWICLARIFLPISTLNLNILNAIGRPDLFMKIDLSKLPLNIIILIITIPLGIKAVVIGHFIMSFISFFINAYLPGKLFGYGALGQIKDTLPVLACTAAMSLVMLAISYFIQSDLLTMIISTIGGILTYYGMASLLKLSTITEVNTFIKNIWYKISKKS